MRVTYGPAMDLSAFYDRPIDRKLLEEVTRTIMDRIASSKWRKEPIRQRDTEKKRRQEK